MTVPVRGPAEVQQTSCVLYGLRELLESPERWTRGALARNLMKQAVVPLSELALSWSLTGAIAPPLMQRLGPKSSQVDWQRLYDAALAALWAALPSDHPRTSRHSSDLDGFNDFPGTHHEDVLALIDRAIAALEA